MIAKLTGLLDSVGENWLVVDVNGVGYLVQSSGRTLGALPATGSEIVLHIETVVREDAITLYGFISTDDREMYRLLSTVQGVGPKVALAILSIAAPDEIRNAIAAQDKGFVGQANGVGPKLAGRIVNELKDKVAAFVLTPTTASASTAKGAAPAAGGGQIEDAVSALVNLGYRPVEAHGAVARAAADLGDGADLSALITAGLKELSS